MSDYSDVATMILVFSMNVSCDKHSKKQTEDFGEIYLFTNRFKKIFETIKKILPDVIGLNEIRHQSNVDFVVELLSEKYEVHAYANNEGDLSFRNVLAVKKDSFWQPVQWDMFWLAEIDNKLTVSSTETKIEGDPFGRGVILVKVQHKTSKNFVFVAVSHVLPFGEIKSKQRASLFSLTDVSKGTPLVIVGDVNRFNEEEDHFTDQKREYDMHEPDLSKLLIYKNGEITKTITEEKDIGTFNPWPTDVSVYDRLRKEPLKNSRLDLQLFNGKHFKNHYLHAVATCLLDLNEDQPPHKDLDKTRYMLDRRLASDHIGLLGCYTCTSN